MLWIAVAYQRRRYGVSSAALPASAAAWVIHLAAGLGALRFEFGEAGFEVGGFLLGGLGAFADFGGFFVGVREFLAGLGVEAVEVVFAEGGVLWVFGFGAGGLGGFGIFGAEVDDDFFFAGGGFRCGGGFGFGGGLGLGFGGGRFGGLLGGGRGVGVGFEGFELGG